ncbi:MAG: hypothetical protein DI596_06855 [Azospira oryzae]|nr:MAG: hypothetical protein DI596_06855 [Azospira oryzae]PZP80216.1 MAG: hypothetical protein DI593_06855 [Azospira oryzae]
MARWREPYASRVDGTGLPITGPFKFPSGMPLIGQRAAESGRCASVVVGLRSLRWRMCGRAALISIQKERSAHDE